MDAMGRAIVVIALALLFFNLLPWVLLGLLLGWVVKRLVEYGWSLLVREPQVLVRGARRMRPPVASGAADVPPSGSALPYWQERGWVACDGYLVGSYEVGNARYEGQVNARIGRYLIRNPPPALRAHPHWACFRPLGLGWYWVHFNTVPGDIGSGIMYVERLLHEAVRSRSAREGVPA